MGAAWVFRTKVKPHRLQLYGEALAEILRPLGMELVLEPGRVIVGNAGILLISRATETRS